MKIKGILIVLILVNTGGRLLAQVKNDSVFTAAVIESYKLTNASTNKTISIKNTSAVKTLRLFIFLSPECPLCKNYAPVINDIKKQFGESVNFVGIVPGRTYSAAVVRAFASKHQLSFPVLIDPVKKLTNYLHAAITPEVILLNERYELVYKGAIDNRVKQLGAKRWQATEYYLADAISQYLQHTSVVVKRVKATGCLINDF